MTNKNTFKITLSASKVVDMILSQNPCNKAGLYVNKENPEVVELFWDMQGKNIQNYSKLSDITNLSEGYNVNGNVSELDQNDFNNYEEYEEAYENEYFAYKDTLESELVSEITEDDWYSDSEITYKINWIK